MYDFFFSSGTGHSLMVLSFVIGIGLILGTIKIKGVSLGSIWVLFVGIVFGALGFKADSLFLHFLKEFGLVLFMFTIGFQVGPSFFSSFRKHRISELLAKFEGRYSVTAIERGAESFTVVDDPVLEAGDKVCADLSSESRMMLRLCFGKEIETEAAGPSVSHSLAATHSIMVTKSSLTGKKIKDLHLDRDYGVTVVRILRSGVELVARLALKQNFYTICGLLSGATTNPVALDFSSQAYRNIHPGVAYAAVYPFALFLQILSAQLLILLCV